MGRRGDSLDMTEAYYAGLRPATEWHRGLECTIVISNKRPKVRRVKSRFFQELESLPLSVLYAKSLYSFQPPLTGRV
jgi:hypothetical protein